MWALKREQEGGVRWLSDKFGNISFCESYVRAQAIDRENAHKLVEDLNEQLALIFVLNPYFTTAEQCQKQSQALHNDVRGWVESLMDDIRTGENWHTFKLRLWRETLG